MIHSLPQQNLEPGRNVKSGKRKIIYCLYLTVVLGVLLGCGLFTPQQPTPSVTPTKRPPVQITYKRRTATSTPLKPAEGAGSKTSTPAVYVTVMTQVVYVTSGAANNPQQPVEDTSTPSRHRSSNPQEETQTPGTLDTSTPTNTPEPTETPLSAPPGVSITTLKSKLEGEKKLGCQQKTVQGLIALTCDGIDVADNKNAQVHVEGYGKGESSTIFIYSVVTPAGASKQFAIDLLGYVGGLPFGSDAGGAGEVQSWIADAINASGEGSMNTNKLFGGVLYNLYGTPDNWFLEIGDPTF